MPREHTTNDKEYARNRKLLLADNPPCTYCGRLADTADHILPHVLGGSNELSNLTPACRSCNSSRGAKLGNRLRAIKELGQVIPTTNSSGNTTSPALNQDVKPNNDAEFFLETFSVPPLALIPISQKPPSVVGTGRQLPRLETITPETAATKASEIVGWAKEVLAVDLLPWQIRVAEGFTAMDENGDYLRRIGYCSVARQNGKSLLMASVLGHFLTVEAARRGTPQTAISVAHKLDLAVSMFKYLAPILEVKYGAKVSWSYGRNELEVFVPHPETGELTGPHRWLVRAATPQAGHGYSADLVLLDEIWSISEAAIDEGLLPTQRARKNPLCLMFSTAGTEASTAMIRWRSQGLRQIDAGDVGPMYFAEWSPPSGLDPLSVEAWEFSNPSMGHLLPVSVLEAEAKAPNRQAFLRSSVNMFTSAANGWLEAGLFDTLKTNAPIPSGGVLAVDSSVDSAHYVGVRAVQDGDKVAVTVAFTVDNLAACWREIEELLTNQSGLLLSIPPTMELSCPPKWERRRNIVGYRELGKWTQPVRAMITEGRLVHTGELLLTEHVERAVMVKANGSVLLSSARSSGPIELARCMVFAAAQASRVQSRQKPTLVVV
jgi:phage terminase large subunit-like protein